MTKWDCLGVMFLSVAIGLAAWGLGFDNIAVLLFRVSGLSVGIGVPMFILDWFASNDVVR